MQKKNIFKALAAAMLMPAMLLTTACSNDDDAIINNEPTVKKGYALPVTVNVTRQGDATTRATYTDNGDRTGSLAFSAGDKLFVNGNDNSVGGAGQFAGTLDYDGEGKFSGTIYTQNSYPGTADALFTDATSILATLLPNGYDTKGFLSIDNNYTTDIAWDDVAVASPQNAFVASETAKATGVEQLSFEGASNYSSGFALAPQCAVLNFTISGLEAGDKTVILYVTYNYNNYAVTGSVTPNASGVATFAIGVPNGANIIDMSDNLTVGTHNFTLPGGTALAAGKIYNITRAAPIVWDFSGMFGYIDLSSGYTFKNVTLQGIGWLDFDEGSLTVIPPTGVTFTAPAGKKFTKIVISGGVVNLDDEGWNAGTWTGSASSVQIKNNLPYITSITFTLADN